MGIFCFLFFFLKPLILYSGNWSFFRDFQGSSWNRYSSIALDFKAWKPVLLWLTQITKSLVTQVFFHLFFGHFIGNNVLYARKGSFWGVAKFVLCRKTLALNARVTWSPFLKFLFIHWQAFGGFPKRFYPPPMEIPSFQCCNKMILFFNRFGSFVLQVVKHITHFLFLNQWFK